MHVEHKAWGITIEYDKKKGNDAGYEKGRQSIETAAKVLAERPWVARLRESLPFSSEDVAGKDLIVTVVGEFQRVFGIGEFAVEVKSSRGGVKSFIAKAERLGGNVGWYTFKNRIVVTNASLGCELVLTDILAQLTRFERLLRPGQVVSYEMIAQVLRSLGDDQGAEIFTRNLKKVDVGGYREKLW